MANRIAVSSKVQDARAESLLRNLKALFPQSALEGASYVHAYTIDTELEAKELQSVALRLTHPVAETYSTDTVPAPGDYAYVIEVGYLPGVTDNVGHTARQTIEDCLGRNLGDGGVYSSYFLFLSGAISEEEAHKMARELHNPLIERATVYARGAEFKVVVPRVELHEHTTTDEVSLDVDDVELTRIGKEGVRNADGTRRGPLSLSLKQLKVIRDYFSSGGGSASGGQKQKRNPTDIELESLAQAWSEHCKHTIFADPLDEVKEGIYRRYIKGATEKIRKAKGKKDFCVSVFKDNSGAIAFDDKYLITHKVETHNSPSGLDPFGGSVTAIVGVNRDCLGFGLGAKPIANVYGFCVADPNDTTELFRDAKKTQPLLPARRILEGVVHGVNAGGNQSGIPTPLGFIAVDASYRGKPLVFGGTVGLIPRKNKGRKLYEKKAKAGDYIVMLGGRVGLDGIHGATFSSESLSGGSPATAVQIGDPITQKKLSDMLIREARDKGLYSSITDDGAGGLSGSVGEMARESGGALVDLEKVPLKYPGLAPWQIWLSESQERMTLAVPKAKWAAFKKICDRHDVEVTRIGEFTKSRRCVIRHNGNVISDIPLNFLHDGRPIEVQMSKKPEVSREDQTPAKLPLKEAVLAMLSGPNVGSISFVSQQYDHEVQGSSVTKPLQGRGRVNADAGVIQPLSDSPRGVVLSHGYAPWYSALDTYAMAAASIDTAVRNAIAAGASRDYLAILDNFCWSSSEKPERLYELKQAGKACYDIATAYGTPFISGKDSMYNDFRGFTADGKPTHIAALPTLLVSAIGVIPDVAKAMTVDFKRVGDLVYVVGETNDELGASEYGGAGAVPVVDAKKNAKAYDAVSYAIRQGLVASAIGIGRGGLAVALAKSAIAGQLGSRVNLNMLAAGAKSPEAILFSESQGRFVISVRRSVQKEFEGLFKGVVLTNIGEVVQDASVSIVLPGAEVELPLATLTESYRSFFSSWGGFASGGKHW
ncbi:phosphoribosylformylglycinamidine synthase [Candidatus Kaiserbacteria bacterium]|nr:phosphoribosylformylglycinamidine synthase [Candidatus Kaiserbacteria bacterium]